MAQRELTVYCVRPIDDHSDIHPDDRVYMPGPGEGYLHYQDRLSFMATCGDEIALDVLVAVYFENRDTDPATIRAVELCTVH